MSRCGRKIPILEIVIEEKDQLCQVMACLLIVKGFGLQKTLATSHYCCLSQQGFVCTGRFASVVS